MATVKEYRRQVSLRPANQQDARVATNPDTFGASIGRAIETLGAGIKDVAAAVEYKEALTADANARKAFNEYRYAQSEALRAPESGYLNRTGENAMGVQQSAEERMRSLRETHGEKLDPRARKKYDEMVDELQQQAHEKLLSHTSNETRNYITNQRKSTIESYLEEAATNWNDQALFERNLGLAMAEQGELAELEGWDAATRALGAETLISAAFRQRIVLAAAEDPVAAEKLLEQARDALNAEDEHALDTGLKQLVLEAKASTFTQQFIRQGGAAGGRRATARYDAVDRTDDAVSVTFAMGPARPERPNQEVMDVITGAAEATFGAGARIVVGSGAEGDRPQHGSDRHQTGLAADVSVYRPDGSLVKATDPDAAQFARAAASAGALGIGFGEEYMGGGSFHVDMVMPGGGQGHFWASGATAIGQELVKIMDRGAASVLAASPYDDSLVNRGIVRQFGDEVGVMIIGAAQNTPYVLAETALSPEVMAANPNFDGMTIGEVYDAVATAIGDDPASRMGRAYFDAQDAYASALAIEDPELRAEVLKSIDTMATLQDRARNEGRRTAQEAAWNEYTATGRTDFPLAVRQAMGQSGWVSFQEAVRNDQRGVDQTDPDTWETLTRMASSEPNKFAELNLASHYPRLAKADRERFILAQEAVRAELRGAAADVEAGRNTIDFDAAYRAADEVYRATVDTDAPSAMNQEQRMKRLQFQQQLTAMIQDFYDRESREPNTREVRELATTLTLPIEFYREGSFLWRSGEERVGGGLFGKPSAFFEAAGRASDVQYRIAVEYDDIPLADRTRIASQIMQTNGGEVPDRDEITEAYEQQRLISAGLPPNVDISSVPEWLIEDVRNDNPSVTDEELVEKYQLFLMSR